MFLLKPPNTLPIEYADKLSIFLAGSIEMGKAEDWQSEFQDLVKDEDIVIFSPRRDDWDSSWEQSIDNPQFNEQVTWELDHIDKAKWVVMYFDPNTKSPITLLELGILACSPEKLIVCCPDGYWRKGNVDIVCKRYGIIQANTKEELFDLLLKGIKYYQSNR